MPQQQYGVLIKGTGWLDYWGDVTISKSRVGWSRCYSDTLERALLQGGTVIERFKYAWS